jgi:hypothetical protein
LRKLYGIVILFSARIAALAQRCATNGLPVAAAAIRILLSGLVGHPLGSAVSYFYLMLMDPHSPLEPRMTTKNGKKIRRQCFSCNLRTQRFLFA